MTGRLLWRLLAIHLLVIGLVIVIVWLTINYLAADYFMALMHEYRISPTDVHQMFLRTVHRYLLGASVAAVILAVGLSLLLTRRVLDPLSRLIEMTGRISGGDYGARVTIATTGEIADLAAAFNRMADSLQRIEQLRKNMVGDVAHELRTPLTNIRGYLEALNDGVIPQTPALVHSLQEEALRLVTLVDDLAQLARADSARLRLEPREMQLRDSVDHALRLARGQFEVKAITVAFAAGPTVPSVEADPDAVIQATSNLLQNAWQYTPEGGRVSIALEPSSSDVKVTVSNSGEGIAADDLPFVFERFYRGDKSRSRESGGAGIGLAIVKELVEASGGKVGAASAEGWTSVWFTLPRPTAADRRRG
ncbi:MAG: ATP-binding protein, partial [Vicinamibacterales bacterium]